MSMPTTKFFHLPAQRLIGVFLGGRDVRKRAVVAVVDEVVEEDRDLLPEALLRQLRRPADHGSRHHYGLKTHEDRHRAFELFLQADRVTDIAKESSESDFGCLFFLSLLVQSHHVLFQALREGNRMSVLGDYKLPSVSFLSETGYQISPHVFHLWLLLLLHG